MKEEKIKEAFLRVKDDIFSLGKEIESIKVFILETIQLLKQINEEIMQLKLEKIAENNDILIKTTPTETPTHLPKTPTHPVTPTETPTHPQEIQGLKSQNLLTSIGNEGVPTDRQTDKPTDQQIFQHMFYPDFRRNNQSLVTTTPEKEAEAQENVVTKLVEEAIIEKPIQQQIREASEILDSLDALKKEIRRKFKKITKQEMLVFSTIYELEEQYREVDYSKIALKLSLSQSSIRDYVQKMINKGIPITKEKLNNKKILLHISPELKKIASLNTIISLREI